MNAAVSFASEEIYSLCITQKTSFYAISGCSCTAVNCMYGHGSLACNWLRCACQGMGQFRASAPTNQRVDNAGYRAKSSREHSAAFFKQRQIAYVLGPFGSTAHRLTDEENSIAFGKSTSQRFYPKPHTP